MKTSDLLQRVDFLIKQGNDTIATKHNSQSQTGIVEYEKYIGFRSAGLSFIKSLFGSEHPYYLDYDQILRNYYESNIASGMEILLAIRNEVANGWLTQLTALVAADIFANFLEMAEHLLEEGYKDAAAVMIGSVLEEHLRHLCAIYNVDTTYVNKGDSVPKKASILNADLKKAAVYTAINEKQVTAWLGLRNSAAHGNYNEYTQAEVKLMYQGVLNFIAEVH